MLLPIAIIMLGGGTWYAVAKRAPNAGMTAERKLVFDQLVNTPQPPKLLREMADVFDKNGLKTQAEFLRGRAAYRELSADKKEAHKAAFRSAMASKDPDAVEAMARAFEKKTATGNAAALRKYASGLRIAAAATGATPPPTASPPPPAAAAPANDKAA